MQSTHPVFTPPSPAIEERVEAYLTRMSLSDKIRLLGGQNFATLPIESADIPAIVMLDGPLGVRLDSRPAVAFPATISLAASWDTDLAKRVGVAMGRESRARGVHILLGPGMNMYRSPLCGRNFEYLGEDPVLAGAMAAAEIRGIQSQGVSACAKHFALNYQEFDRNNVSSDVDERTLREVYLPAFRECVEEAGVGCVMTAYNLVNDVHAAEHKELITDILKGDWDFQGVVMSDWVSVYNAVASANAGLDLEMPFGDYFNTDKLLPAIRDGRVSTACIDDKVRRILRLALCFGFFDRLDDDSSIPDDDPANREVSLDVARSGSVLLKNEGLLPLDSGALRRVVVVGPNAETPFVQGGGSAANKPLRTCSLAEALREQLGDGVQVESAVGCNPTPEFDAFNDSQWQTTDGRPGLEACFYNNQEFAGEPVHQRVDARPDFVWGFDAPVEEVEANRFSVRWTGHLMPRESGLHHLYISTDQCMVRVWVDDKLLGELHSTVAPLPVACVPMELEGESKPVVRIECIKIGRWAKIHVGYLPKRLLDEAWDQALELVDGADAVICAVGFNRHIEGENQDRSFELPAGQDEFIGAVAKRNPRCAVALFAGGNVAMEAWIDAVPALLHAWYPGQEGMRAVAEILLGRSEPKGRLPISCEAFLEDRSSSTCYHDEDGDKRVDLSDGIFGGYRHHDRSRVPARFPFGFGLSYTEFAIDDVQLASESLAQGEDLRLSCRVRNTGDRPGREVVQVYIGADNPRLPWPEKILAGFAAIELAAGEEGRVDICISAKRFLSWDIDAHDWCLASDTFSVMAGQDSVRLPLRKQITITG